MYEIPTKYIPLPPIRKGEEDYQQRQLVKTTTDQTISLHEPTVTCSCPFQCNCHNNTPLIPNYHATDGMFTAPPSYESTKTIINSAISEYAEKRDISEKLAKTEIFQGYLFGRVLQGEKVANELAERVSQYNGIQDQLVRDTKVLEDGLKDNQMMNVSLINDERLLQRSLENILSVTKSLQDQLNQIHSTQSTHSSVISNHTEILTSIRSQSKSHFTQLESHHEQILTHQSQLQSQATSISTLNSNINNQLTNLASQSQTAINNILKHQKSELDKVDAKIRDMQTHLKRVENGTNSLYPEINRLDSDFSAMKNNVEDRFYHYQHKVAEVLKTDFLQMNNDQIQRIGKLQDDIVQIKKIVRDLNASEDCEIQKLKELVFGIQNFIKAAREEETASVLELRKEIEVMRLESERIKKELFTEIRRISKPVFVM
ncbi:hypothetical protein HK098_005564 [Nowakowskiella sp. JEL0407]|nr:hypothetical protein HK098_005564 [Nowakowskiella sp. JEL0407]